jgi:hypothetical protein
MFLTSTAPYFIMTFFTLTLLKIVSVSVRNVDELDFKKSGRILEV